jgi:hypothetical protein
MKRSLLSLAFLLAGGSVSLFAVGIPDIPQGVVELESFGRLFLPAGKFDPYVEVLGRFEDTSFQFRYRSVTMGSYYRPLNNLKLGLFFRVQAGARHNNDWIEGAGGVWQWNDTRGRYEGVLIADVSPRFLVSFIDRNLVFMLKNRFEFNTFNRDMSVFVRPGLTYFIMSARQPVAEISLQFATYFALNFGDAPIYSFAPYLQFLYHITPQFQLAAGMSYQTITWSTSADAKIWAVPNSYMLNYTAFRFQAGFIYTLPLK